MGPPAVRALTVRQPWAEAIADGKKLVENRSAGFPKKYRGPVAIHAGQGWSTRGQRDPRIRELYTFGRPGGVSFARGYVIAVAELVDAHPAAGCCQPWGEETYPPANPEGRPPGRVTHLVLENVVRTPPIAARGLLGLWRPDDELEVEIAHALAELVSWDLEGARRIAADDSYRGDNRSFALWRAIFSPSDPVAK